MKPPRPTPESDAPVSLHGADARIQAQVRLVRRCCRILRPLAGQRRARALRSDLYVMF